MLLETIAVYWESKVKVYGISHVSNLSMVRLVFPVTATEELGKALIPLEDTVQRFELVTQDYIDSTLSQMTLFYNRAKEGKVATALRKWGDEMQATIALTSPLELIYLHGPHFQERFGIVDIAFSALKDANIKIITAGCAGTTVYIAMPEKQGLPATRILQETFIIPTTN